MNNISNLVIEDKEEVCILHVLCTSIAIFTLASKDIFKHTLIHNGVEKNVNIIGVQFT